MYASLVFRYFHLFSFVMHKYFQFVNNGIHTHTQSALLDYHLTKYGSCDIIWM